MFDAGLGEKPDSQSEFLRFNCLHYKWLHSSASINGCGARKSCPALMLDTSSPRRHYYVLSVSRNPCAGVSLPGARCREMGTPGRVDVATGSCGSRLWPALSPKNMESPPWVTLICCVKISSPPLPFGLYHVATQHLAETSC